MTEYLTIIAAVALAVLASYRSEVCLKREQWTGAVLYTLAAFGFLVGAIWQGVLLAA